MTLPRGWELVLVVLVVVLLFGAKRMPDAARSVGRSLRIFKAETKGLADDGPAEKPAEIAPSPAPVVEPIAPPTEKAADTAPSERAEG
jgi:sec-independent protein translocase protein TatA